MEPLRFVVYSDYLCPWCYNAAVRLDRLERESGGSVELIWRSYLLRPSPTPGRDLEKFRSYTRSWLRPAEEPDSGEFRVWQGDAGPPSHSVPPHRVAKAAASLGDEAFRRIHPRLLHAYFAENRDISDPAVLRCVWSEAGLPDSEFARSEDPSLLEQVVAEHREALDSGVTGVPAVRLEGNDAVIVGAHPLALYRRWVERMHGRSERGRDRLTRETEFSFGGARLRSGVPVRAKGGGAADR
ncbi:MAG: DsbA family protein [Myxococcota bacterium]|jgi:predicted DsbA family dithiol-disulfide isomerase